MSAQTNIDSTFELDLLPVQTWNRYKQDISFETARAYVEALDLDYLIAFMSSPRYPLPRWSFEDATHCCKLYKNFLILLKKNLPEFLVPTREIDEFWHNHILYTKNYSRDTQAIFGHYLHHDPASPDETPDKLVQGYLKTKQYYLEEFKVPLEIFHQAIPIASAIK